ncbi:acid protease [Boletus edulis]|uniref:Aspartic peptidase domain-containing protein n=1 Tax=Boletus edulis BED1 TaxID=1328754 RepID=A0AAD4BL71_BOLED|nr:acid protease [Boletus edulis]KAF8124048.1 acid protease [Boletus edulis]KAF8433742.1 aspartic peptidase domain-containing protein [Boletus edulis BED1]
MFSSHTFLSLLLIACTAVDASFVSRSTSKATLPFMAKLNEGGSPHIIDADRTRVQAMKVGHLNKRSIPEVGITNAMLVYTAEVGVGDPATNYSLLIDTGSANTWLGANKSYVQTKTSRDTGEDFFIRYGIGNVTGKVWNDTVSFSPSLIISQQAIGVANSSNGFSGFDGILGVGPTDLTGHAVHGVDRIPTVMDNLFSQGTISEESLGIYFIPAPETTKKGELTFGGYDDSVIVGPVTYVPLTKTRPTSLYWGITQSISYGSNMILSPANGIVDTGSTITYIASDAYEQYKNKTGATYDPATQMLKITAEQYDCLEPLVFNIGDAAYELTANAQIWPRSLNSLINGTSDGIYLVVSDLGPFNFTGVDFINGYTFLERFYSVYDTTHGAVGFAKTQYTYADVN